MKVSNSPKKKEKPKCEPKKKQSGVKKRRETKAVGPVKDKPSKPPKFSWIVEGVLAGHGRPTKLGHLLFLQTHGIKHIITLTENKPTILRDNPMEFIWHHIPVKDEKPPTQEQVCQFIQIVENCQQQQEPVSVHCAWGRGRTGTLSACYLAHTRNCSASEAVRNIRELRPGSIDTIEQENVVKDYVQAKMESLTEADL